MLVIVVDQSCHEDWFEDGWRDQDKVIDGIDDIFPENTPRTKLSRQIEDISKRKVTLRYMLQEFTLCSPNLKETVSDISSTMKESSNHCI